MAEDTTILGFTQVNLFIGSSQPDTDLMVVLHDVDEAGNTTYLQRDFVRASLRAIDPAASTDEEQLRRFDRGA
jgi:predicted acyl esterase